MSLALKKAPQVEQYKRSEKKWSIGCEGPRIDSVLSGALDIDTQASYQQAHREAVESIASAYAKFVKVVDIRQLDNKRLTPRQMFEFHKMHKDAVASGLQGIAFLHSPDLPSSAMTQILQFRGFLRHTRVDTFTDEALINSWAKGLL